VQKGQQVQAGDEIAEVGNRGHSTGPHLHLEIWDTDGTKLNPLPWLKRHGIAY
jgi:murein DD-endopeptidase MepM/ murein hydrolase activator NlpD